MHLPTKSAIIAYLGDISALLVPLAALPYTLGDIANILPPRAKVAVTVIASFSAAALKLTQRIMERARGLQDASGIVNAQNAAQTARKEAQTATVLALNLPAEKQIPPVGNDVP